MNSYEEIKSQLDKAMMDTPCAGTNSDGEDVIVEHGKDEGGKFFSIATFQKNNWVRVNTYYESGDQTESFDGRI